MSPRADFEEAAYHAGFAMAHAIAVASTLQQGELICPFVIVSSDGERRSEEFEAETQDDAVSLAWSSFERYKERVDSWALAREGLRSRDGSKHDVLVVAAWAAGMSEPLVFVQEFRPKGKGGFSLVGALEVPDLPESALTPVGHNFFLGIDDHPKAHLWKDSRANDA